MGNQQGKPNMYEQYYDALRNKKELPQVTHPTSHGSGRLGVTEEWDIEDANPYEVLGLSKNFTWEELKTNYHRIARLVHPDKGGNEKLFNLVSNCFRKLAYEYKARQEDKPHHELKKESQWYHEKNSQDLRAMPPIPMNTSTHNENESFHDRFNRVFQEFRIEEETERGYGSMMTPSSKTRDDINIDRKVKKFTNEAFNEEFNKIPVRQQVVKYKEPEPLVLTKNIAYTEIGEKPDDFTRTDPTAKTGLFYTDYMQAFHEGNQRLVDPNTIKRKEFKTIEQYDNYRSQKTNRKMSSKEIQYMAQQKELEEKREQERLERVKHQDEVYRVQHEKLKRMMIQQ